MERMLFLSAIDDFKNIFRPSLPPDYAPTTSPGSPDFAVDPGYV